MIACIRRGSTTYCGMACDEKFFYFTDAEHAAKIYSREAGAETIRCCSLCVDSYRRTKAEETAARSK